jgi:chromate transporter
VNGSLKELCVYFLRLGALGFGGPIALAGYMHKDLVEDRNWISSDEYKEGLALAQLAPGPLAAQLAMYLGWVKGGRWGATLAGICFVMPSFVLVLGLAWAYLRFGGLSWMQGAFFGIGAAVIAIIARSVSKLVKVTLKRDRLLWVLFLVLAVTTAWTEEEIVWLFLGAGLVAMAVRSKKPSHVASIAPWMLTGLHGPADFPALGKIAWFFATAGAFVFGSGLAIVPFLHSGVVKDFGWLTEQQFLDAVAVAMITPGPVVITVAFIGYLVGGPAGAAVAAAAVFFPCWVFVVVPAPYFRRIARNENVVAFVDGVTAAATGAIAGAAVVLGRRALLDASLVPMWGACAVFAVTMLLTWRFKKLPEPAIVLAAGVAGIAIHAS